MRTILVSLLLSFVTLASSATDNPRPAGKNCALSAPPPSAGEESNHGAILRIFPRARDIDSQYTGCQALFAQYNGQWAVVSLTEVVKGDPVRIWSEQDPDDDSLSCRYRQGKVVQGNPDTCPMPEFILLKSLAPGCAQVIREDAAKRGLGAPTPKGCQYE